MRINTGTDVVVYSSVDPIVVNGTVQADPQWECIVDGNSFGLDQIDQADNTPQNNIDICHGILSDGPHELLVRVTSKGNPFYLDDIQYTPSVNADLSNTEQKIYNSDPNISLSEDFKQGTFGVYQTQTPGGTVSFNFNGTSITWIGYIFANFAQQSATATWSVDSSDPISFALPTSAVSFGNSIFFTTNNLSVGAHSLLVTYKGNTNAMPLTLDYFFLRNDVNTTEVSSINSTVTTTSTSGTATSTSPGANTSAPGKSHVHSGVIGGGIAGGVLVFILVAAFVIMRKRRRKTYSAVTKQEQFEQDGSDGRGVP